MPNPSELAKHLLRVALQALMVGVAQPLAPDEREAWELILNQLDRLPAERRALDQLSKDPASLQFRHAFLAILQELLNQDQALVQAIARLLILPEKETAPTPPIRPIVSGQASYSIQALEEASSGEATKEVAKMGGSESSDVQFTAFYSKELNPAFWYNLPVYIHLPSMLEAISEDSQGFVAHSPSSGKSSSAVLQTIQRGSEIVAVPELPGCIFNPPRNGIFWLEDWHRMEFRVRAQADTSFQKDSIPTLGRIAFYVGPLLVAETKIWAQISDQFNAPQSQKTPECESGNAYKAIFVSYSHQDLTVVEKLETAYKALGMQYLRDVESLRSGEQWNSALLKMIETADIFQLYWSAKAQQSRYVEQEWRYALGLQRENFIRPVYWEKPMPPVPAELNAIHFAPINLT